jgi:hypothetical protein
MMTKMRWILAVVGLLSVAAALHGQQGNGVKNGKNKDWIVKYHINNKNKTGDAAIRLHIDEGSKGSSSLSGKLYRYSDKNSDGFYVPRSDDSAVIDLTGEITGNQEEGYLRKRETFEMSGEYEAEDGMMHDVTVKGFFYAGPDKGKASKHRHDDILIIRINDVVRMPVPPPAPGPGVMPVIDNNCDDDPPDEDVLTEDNTEDPPEYDPDDPEGC